MPELSMETKITHYVDYGDLQEFFSELTGNEIEIIGSANDTDYSEEIYPPDTTKQYFRADQEEIDEFLKSRYIDLSSGDSFNAGLQYAADEGLIPYGAYVINVSW